MTAGPVPGAVAAPPPANCKPLGEFVYHCHILEHEDGGMMARVMVVPAAF